MRFNTRVLATGDDGAALPAKHNFHPLRSRGKAKSTHDNTDPYEAGLFHVKIKRSSCRRDQVENNLKLYCATQELDVTKILNPTLQFGKHTRFLSARERQKNKKHKVAR